MKNLQFTILFTTGLIFSLVNLSCEKDLRKPVLGAISEEQLTNKSGIESLLIGAYAALDGAKTSFVGIGGGGTAAGSPTNWVGGSVGGGEAHFGLQGSQIAATRWAIDPSISYANDAWNTYYEGVARANAVIRVLSDIEDLTETERASYEGQARFIRGHFYFYLKKLFNNVPWIDENTVDFIVPNTEDIWPYIEADFRFAMDNLPETHAEVGRANMWAAAAYLGKTYLFQKKYPEAKEVFDLVISNGKTASGETYGLLDKFSDNFDATTENGKEAVFQVQMITLDNTFSVANANAGEIEFAPFNSPGQCCGAFRPSQDLVNSYRTDALGLPLFDTYNQSPIKDDIGLSSQDIFVPDDGYIDSRLDWTVGRRGLPFHDWGLHPGRDWAPDQPILGPYASKKNLYWQYNSESTASMVTYAPGTAINVNIIRFADVLLMAAEVEAEIGNLDLAESYVNRVRSRASGTASWLNTYLDVNQPQSGFSATPAANYNVKPYPVGTFYSYGKELALQAIYFERKLELALEGHRFYDLSRWGIASEVMNAYFQYEQTKISDVAGAVFTGNRNEYYPIPQNQIDLMVNSRGERVLQQNRGYQ